MAVVSKFIQKWERGSYVQKKKKYTKHRILKIENNIKKEKVNMKRILKNVSKLLRGYLPIEKEEKNGSSVRHSTVQYMVLAVLDG